MHKLLLNWEETKNFIFCFSLDFGSECLQKRKKSSSMSVFVLDSKTKDNKIVLQREGFEISGEQQGLLLQSRKKVKRWQTSEKPIETTTESSFMSFLASGASFLGCKAAKWVKKSQSEVPRHIKIIGWRTFSEVYCSGREASRKTPVSSMLSILQGKCRTFRKYIEQKWAWLNLPCPLRK